MKQRSLQQMWNKQSMFPIYALNEEELLAIDKN